MRSSKDWPSSVHSEKESPTHELLLRPSLVRVRVRVRVRLRVGAGVGVAAGVGVRFRVGVSSCCATPLQPHKSLVHIRLLSVELPLVRVRVRVRVSVRVRVREKTRTNIAGTIEAQRIKTKLALHLSE